MFRIIILLAALSFFFSATSASMAATEKGNIKIVPWVCDEYNPQIEILNNCYRQSFTKNPFQVQLMEKLPQQINLYHTPIVATLILPALSGKGPRVLIEYGNIVGEVWRVQVVGTIESPWAAGLYDAYAVIPQ